MAAFRKISHELAKRYDESSPENSLDLSESFKASLCSDEENVNDFEELEESSEELPGGKGLGLSQSSTKKKGKKGRKASWPDEFVNEMVEEICENEHFCRRLIFTNNKAYKNLEIYQKVVAKVAKKLMEERQQEFTFTAQQARTKFKACVAACKKASMTRRTKSGIANFMENKPKWFHKLFPYVESRDSCNPEMAKEPSFQVLDETVTSDVDSLGEEATKGAEGAQVEKTEQLSSPHSVHFHENPHPCLLLPFNLISTIAPANICE
eukprot:gene6460-7192_t